MLLDSVPDSVLICTQGNEDYAPKILYANTKMKNFFGSDVTRPLKKKRMSRGMQPITVKSPMMKAIFNSTIDMMDTKLSLSQIIGGKMH